MIEKLRDAMNEISDSHIAEAAKAKRFIKTRSPWFGVIAAILALAIILNAPNIFIAIRTPELAARPIYPAAQKRDQPQGYADSLTDFLAKSMPEFLSGDGNQVYSPLNVYMALAMLAETASGESRQQLLDLFGVDSIKALQTQASHVWNAHFYNIGNSTASVLANSLWLDDAISYRNSTVNTLAKKYYASVYRGDLGSQRMNTLLQDWLSEQSRGFLKDQANSVELDPSTVFALASTVYFQAEWISRFNGTSPATFYGPNGNTTVDFMSNSCVPSPYYWGNDFTAIKLSVSGEHDMWLILPNRGQTPQDVLDSGEYLGMIQSPVEWENQSNPTIRLRMPKFDISNKKDLISGLKNMGITEIFGSNADFSPLTENDVHISKIDHAVRVAVDEDGITAAAFTVIVGNGGMPSVNEVDFLLNRPFLFVITSLDNFPLFAGVVNQP